MQVRAATLFWAACVLSGDTERSLLQHLQLSLLAIDAAFGLGRRFCVLCWALFSDLRNILAQNLVSLTISAGLLI